MPGTRGPVPVPLQANGGTTDLTLLILETLESQDPLQTQDAFPQHSQAEIKAALDRLASRSMVSYETHDAEQVGLTGEGQQICDEGSHEYKVWDAVNKARRLGLKDPAVCLKQEKIWWKEGMAWTDIVDSSRHLLRKSDRAMPSS